MKVQISQGVFGAGDVYTEYVDCVFDGAKLSNVKPGRATSLRCSFRDVQIRSMFSHSADFADCIFTWANSYDSLGCWDVESCSASGVKGKDFRVAGDGGLVANAVWPGEVGRIWRPRCAPCRRTHLGAVAGP